MRSKNAKTITLFTLISIATLLFILWLVDFSPFGIPELIPGIGYRTYGILILLAFLIIIILLQKILLRTSPEISVFGLIASSAIVTFTSLFIYQIIRNCFVLDFNFIDKLSTILLSSAVPTIIFTILAATYAFSFKKVGGVWSRIPLVLLIIVVILTKYYVHEFNW